MVGESSDRDRSNACDYNDSSDCIGAESIQSLPIQPPEGLDLLSQDDLMRAMSDNPHMGCPDAGCGPDCPARLTGRVEHAAECKTTGGRDVRNLKDGRA